MGHCQLSNRILVEIYIVKLKGNHFNMRIVDAPTAQSNEKEIEKFYCTLDKTKF